MLVREDGSYLYTLPSVVDDLDLAVTDVIRGEDHVTNTAVQVQLAQALGRDPPRFAHHNLLTTASGEGLSKRSGSLSIAGLREDGIESLAVAAFAVLTGTSDAVQPVASLDALAGLFDLAHVSRNPTRFDPAELSSLSARTLHGLPYAAVAERLAGLGDPSPEAFWLAVRGNLAPACRATCRSRVKRREESLSSRRRSRGNRFCSACGSPAPLWKGRPTSNLWTARLPQPLQIIGLRPR